MRIRRLHAWDEWHEANGAFPSKRWTNIGGVWAVLADAAHPSPPVNPSYAYYTQALDQTGNLRYYWSMKSVSVAPFDMSLHVREGPVGAPNPVNDDSYRVQQTDTNLKLIRYNAGAPAVATVLQNIGGAPGAALANTDYWFVLDINFTTGVYLLYRATHASPEDDTAALMASGTDPAPLAGLVNANIVLRTDTTATPGSTDANFDHFKVMGPNITNYVNLHCETPITDGCGSWKMEAVNTSGTNTYAELGLGDLIEIAILDDSVNPPVEWVEFSGWVEELEQAESHSGMWNISGRDFRSQLLIAQTNDSFPNPPGSQREAIMQALTDTYASTASERICLTKNDIASPALGVIGRDFKGITPLQAITDLTREQGREYHHVITRDRRWKVNSSWPAAVDAAGAAITIDEADGKVVEVIEHKDGTTLWNHVRAWPGAGGIGDVTDGVSTSLWGQTRTVDIVDLRIQTNLEALARANWWLNNFSTAYRVFELTCAGYIGLYPGESVTLTLTSYGVVAQTYGCLKRIVGYPEPGLITFILSQKDTGAGKMTQKMPWESARRLAGVAWDGKNALAQQV